VEVTPTAPADISELVAIAVRQGDHHRGTTAPNPFVLHFG
jgi:hypothetical protein